METPSITGSVGYTSSAIPLSYEQNVHKSLVRSSSPVAAIYAAAHQIPQDPPSTTITTSATKDNNMATRVVKVYIADPNENLALQDQLIYSGAEKLTDSTNEELFFEISITELLTAHNEKRKATVDKKQSERFGKAIYLEPVRIRDLKMVVAAIAEFK